MEDQARNLESIAQGLDNIQARHRLGPDGKEHPFFAWRPRCAPWHPEGNLTFQRDVLSCKARKVAIIAGNGAGKTITLCRLAAALACGFDPLTKTKPAKDQLIWILTEPKLVDPLFRRVIEMVPQRYWLERPYRSKGEQHLVCVNGRIQMKSTGMPPEEFQQENVSKILADEEPPKKILDECMARLRRDDSQFIWFATPVRGSQSMDNEFNGFRESERGAIDGKVAWFSASVEDNDTLPKEFIEEQKRRYKNDPDMYKIRVLGQFVNLRGRHIFADAIEFLESRKAPAKEWLRFGPSGSPFFSKEHVPLSWDLWRRPIPGRKHVIGADLSEGGLLGDYTAAFVLDVDSGEIIARFHGKIEPGPFGRELAFCGHFMGNATLNWEMNMQGAAVLDRLRQMHYPRLALRESFGGRVKTAIQTYGFRTDHNSKHAIITNLQDGLKDGLLLIPDHDTIEELANFGYLRKEESTSKTVGMGALDGHDDLVMALAITWYTGRRFAMSGRAPDPEKSFDEQLFEEALEEVSGQKKRRPSIFSRPFVGGLFSTGR